MVRRRTTGSSRRPGDALRENDRRAARFFRRERPLHTCAVSSSGRLRAIPGRRGNPGGVGPILRSTTRRRERAAGKGCNRDGPIELHGHGGAHRLLPGLRLSLPRHEHPLVAQQRRGVLRQHTERSKGTSSDDVVSRRARAPRLGRRRVGVRRRRRPRRADRSRRTCGRWNRPDRARRAGSATASGSPGKPAPEPMSTIREAERSSGTSSPDRLSATCSSAAWAGSRIVVGGSASEARAASRAASCSAAPSGELVELGELGEPGDRFP